MCVCVCVCLCVCVSVRERERENVGTVERGGAVGLTVYACTGEAAGKEEDREDLYEWLNR